MLEIANISVTCFMIGLIWLVQVVHYPTFLRFSDENFRSFHSFHTKSITKIVAPMMGIELLLATVLVWNSNFHWKFFLPLIMIIGIWVSTACLQIPYHNKLADGFDLATTQKLIRTNWIRTILWTIKGFWLIVLYF